MMIRSFVIVVGSKFFFAKQFVRQIAGSFLLKALGSDVSFNVVDHGMQLTVTMVKVLSRST